MWTCEHLGMTALLRFRFRHFASHGDVLTILHHHYLRQAELAVAQLCRREAHITAFHLLRGKRHHLVSRIRKTAALGHILVTDIFLELGVIRHFYPEMTGETACPLTPQIRCRQDFYAVDKLRRAQVYLHPTVVFVVRCMRDVVFHEVFCHTLHAHLGLLNLACLVVAHYLCLHHRRHQQQQSACCHASHDIEMKSVFHRHHSSLC